MKLSDCKIGFVGFGHLAESLWKGQAQILDPSRVYFTRKDPSKGRETERRYGIAFLSLEELVQESDLVFLCTRPDQAPSLLRKMEKTPPRSLVSVVAGLRLEQMQKHLPIQTPLLRTLPNLAVSVGQGLTALCYQGTPRGDFREWTHLFFLQVGTIVELSERQMNLACAVGGSGVGLVLLWIDAIAQEMERQGVDRAQALQMSAQTVLGSASLVLQGKDPVSLIRSIATPGGTTQAAVAMFQNRNLSQGLVESIQAAQKRAEELFS